MYGNKKICLLLVEFLMMVVCKAEHNYLDEKSSEVRRNYKAVNENSCKKELRECRDISHEILSRKIVNMLLSRIDFKEGDSWFNGRVELEGTASELETLKNFGLGILTLQEVSPILDDVIKTTEFSVGHECALCLNSVTSQLFETIDTYLYIDSIISIFLVLYLIRMLRNRQFNFRQIVFLGFFWIYAAVFVNTLPDTLREVEQEINMTEAPIHCRPDKMNWTDKIMGLFASAKDCETYEAEMNNRRGTIYKVAIFRAMDRTIRAVMVLSINIGFIIVKLLTNFLLGLVTVIIATFVQLSITTIVMLMLILYGFYSFRSTYVRRWEPRRSLRNTLHEEAFPFNPNHTRNRRPKRRYETLW